MLSVNQCVLLRSVVVVKPMPKRVEPIVPVVSIQPTMREAFKAFDVEVYKRSKTNQESE